MVQSVKNRAKYFKDNVKYARKAATAGFLWVYGEKGSWWPNLGAELWETQVPGITDALFSESWTPQEKKARAKAAAEKEKAEKAKAKKSGKAK